MRAVEYSGVVTVGEARASETRKDETDVTFGVRVSGQFDEIGWVLHTIRPGARVRVRIAVESEEQRDGG